MNEIYRVIREFRINGKRVYSLKSYTVHNLSVGDRLYDLRGYWFEVISLVDIRKTSDEESIEVRLKNEFDDEDLHGTILVKEIVHIKFNYLLLNNSDNPNKVDGMFKNAYDLIKKSAKCGLINYFELENGNVNLYGDEISGLTSYYGYNMKPEMYKILYDYLEERGIYLIKMPQEYKLDHYLPDWYKIDKNGIKILAEPVYFTKFQFVTEDCSSRPLRILYVDLLERIIVQESYVRKQNIPAAGEYKKGSYNNYFGSTHFDLENSCGKPYRVIKSGKHNRGIKANLETFEYDIAESNKTKLTDKDIEILLPFCNALEFFPYNGIYEVSLDSYLFNDINRKSYMQKFIGVTNSYVPKIEIQMNYARKENHSWPPDKLLFDCILKNFFCYEKRCGYFYMRKD